MNLPQRKILRKNKIFIHKPVIFPRAINFHMHLDPKSIEHTETYTGKRECTKYIEKNLSNCRSADHSRFAIRQPPNYGSVLWKMLKKISLIFLLALTSDTLIDDRAQSIRKLCLRPEPEKRTKCNSSKLRMVKIVVMF